MRRNTRSLGSYGRAFAAFFIDRYLTADPRWLGIFRWALGLLLSVDLIRRWSDVRFYYTNDGILPNHFSLFAPMGHNAFSIYHAFSSFNEVSLAFGLTLVVFVLFTIGFKTKLFHILSAVCITSLNARNIFVENGGTVVVNLLTIWTLFAPLGQRFSVDALRRSLRARVEQTAGELNDRSEIIEQRPFVSLAVLAWMLQWSTIYFFNAVHKSGRGWKDGSALHWFYEQDRIVTWLGVWVRENVPFEALRVMTYGSVVVEGILAFILLVPVFQTQLRRLAFLLALLLHGGIALSSRLGPFSYVMVIFFLLLFGEREFQLLARWFGRERRARTVIFDSGCGVCFWICRVLRRLDFFERLVFVPNDDVERFPEGVNRQEAERSVLALTPEGRVFSDERALFEIGRALPFGILAVFWLRLPGLAWLARRGYRVIVENRHRISSFMGLAACGLEPSVASARAEEGSREPPSRTWRHELAGFGASVRETLVALLLIIYATQVARDNPWLRQRVSVPQPRFATLFVQYTRSLQGWGMFAPEPPYEDGHLVVDGRTVDNRKLDPFTGKEPDFDPYSKHGWGHDQLWCDYNNRIRYQNHRGYRPHLEAYLKNWHLYAERPEDRLVAFDVWWVQDKSPPPGERRGTPLAPEKLLSFGHVRDSGAREWLKKAREAQAEQRRRDQRVRAPGGSQ